MYVYCPHPPPLITLSCYNRPLALPDQWRIKKIIFRSTQRPFMTDVRAESSERFLMITQERQVDGQNEQKLGWTSTEGGNAGLVMW